MVGWVDALKKLFFAVKREDPKKRQVSRVLGTRETVKSHLVPMIEQHGRDRDSFEILCILLTKLTYPLTPDVSGGPTLMRILRILQQYKELFATTSVLAMVMFHLRQPLAKPIE